MNYPTKKGRLISPLYLCYGNSFVYAADQLLFFNYLTIFADIPTIIQYLFFSANMFSMFIVEHITCRNLFYGFRKQFPLGKNEMDMIVGFAFVRYIYNLWFILRHIKFFKFFLKIKSYNNLQNFNFNIRRVDFTILYSIIAILYSEK